MKRKIKIIIILALILINIPVKAETKYERGDLRCPLTLPVNVKCYETKNNQGVVTQVDLVYGSLEKEGDIQITKTVTKKLDELGHYYVKFNVKGNNVSQKKTAGDVYIALILDFSETIKNQISSVQKGAQTFASTLIPSNENGSSNYYIKLIQFSSKSVDVTKGFKNSNFANTTFKTFNELGVKESDGKTHYRSHIETALGQVAFPKGDEKKFVVIFGDGRYWSNDDSNPGLSVSRANELKKLGANIYGIRYDGKSLKSTLSKRKWAGNAGCKPDECSYEEADKRMMKKLVTNYSEASGDLNKVFQKIANQIVDIVEEDGSSFTTDLTDRIGDDFYLTDDVGDYQRFNVGKLTESGWSSPSFEIEINQYAKGNESDGGGWHETNENFNLTYTDENGNEHVLGVDVNPEVYWIPYDLNLHTCHDSSTAGSIREDESDENQIFTKSCREGYMENGVNKNGFTTEAIVNNLDVGVRKFNILSGTGFPSLLKMSTNVVCTYKFNADEFNKKYGQLQKGLNSEDLKEQVSAAKKIDKLNSILQNYLNFNTQEDLKNYAKRFEDQNAELTITYNNSKSSSDKFSYENIKETVNTSDIKCTANKTEKINGVNRTTATTCYASFSKEMQIKESCLNMQTGEQESCKAESNNQIAGGNNAYTKLKENSGYITIKVPNAGYNGDLDIELKKNGSDDKLECEFNGEDKLSNISYRQIELTDPFLKKYDINRGVGGNYLNTKFDFEKIIDEDTWDSDKEAEYEYLLSKTNINNIKKDTNEDYQNSYLGRNCYFTDNNQFICEFTRNGQGEGLTNDRKWFYSAKFKDEVTK